MALALYLLLAAGLLGAFDVVYFHWYRCRLQERPECQTEVLLHTIRHVIYASQFLWVANLRFHGAALYALAALYAIDIAIAWSDVLVENDSRRGQGGLPRGEYFMHVLLSLIIGAYLLCVFQAVWPDRLLPTAIVVDPPPVPPLLRLLMTVMGASALVVFALDLRGWIGYRREARRAATTAATVAPAPSGPAPAARG